jgi:hypothetical protein
MQELPQNHDREPETDGMEIDTKLGDDDKEIITCYQSFCQQFEILVCMFSPTVTRFNTASLLQAVFWLY